MIIGYYIFLGSGDYHKPRDADSSWTYTWSIKEWENFIDGLIDLNVNTLFIYMNGHRLPYRSLTYPELVDSHSANNDPNFLPDLLKYIKSKGLMLICVLSTTGHAGGFFDKHPDASIEISTINPNIEESLISFPEHLKKGKLKKNDGAAQLGFGVLCHHKTVSQEYSQLIIEEISRLYGEYFDGVTLHPPESAFPCECQLCCKSYELEYGVNLKSESFDKKCSFFIKSYLKFQNDVLINLLTTNFPKKDIFLFTIPWLFEKNFVNLKNFISKDITLIDWDYNLDETRVSTLSQRLLQYISEGYKVIFMPTAGFSINQDLNTETQVHSIYKQMETAENLECTGIVHFTGPRISQYFHETSLKSYYEFKRNLEQCISIRF